MNYRVRFSNVTKKYKMYNKPLDKLKDLFFKTSNGEYHYALNNVSFEVTEGEIVGIIGLNGSGKSTLSNLIAGVTMPSKGTIDIKGSATLIAISSGLNGQLTGIENIELKGLMMGLKKEEIKEITPKVIEFAEIGKFIHQPVKTYSSGMKSRLGFAISAHINPDILVIDEALSVGDQTFTKKCLDKMNEFKEQGKTIFFISHSISQVKSFCTKALWLHYGHVREYGNIKEVITHYNDFLKGYNGMNKEEKQRFREEQMMQFQHGLLQGAATVESHGNYGKRNLNRPKRKKGVMIGCCLAMIAGIISTGFFYTGVFSKNRNNVEVENITSRKKPIETKPVEKFSTYIVNSNGISIREEADASSKRLAVANFGDIITISDSNKNEKKDVEWIQVTLSNGEFGWISTKFIEPLKSNNNIIEDAKLADVTALLKRVYGGNMVSAPTYFGKTLNELETTYPQPLNPLPSMTGKTIVIDGNIQFGISQDKVVEVVFQDISMSIAKLHELLGKESLSNDAEKNYFYETKSYYIAARSDQTHKEIQSISIVKK
ncbi:teichoic acids export ABC transporter ATP-binding subunit TagH [Bacillus sp. CD3-1a]|uniref:teichoic acids export ABC transporter ATP-binding subunit TagH n=1 Tax=Bacillus sp. CD3-1a TaxID=2587158 RepID=UPI00111FBB1B|nr:teichoic acids export ABC transporter ATP-binding subunit TagH [Bacillus sp. CD3-1a]TNO95821.1 teichoic acids export ABC transporter ATP-binding subunit TagH [Bacillus sp. CD3-1a]